jgi:hypothetical protein
MGVLRTVVAMGALLVSVPMMAQPGRSGADRARADRGGDSRRERQEPRGGGGRIEPRRVEPRGGDPRFRAPEWTRGRVERRDEPRIAVRPPVIIDRYDRYDRHAPRVLPPPVRYSTPVRYRYGDRDFRHRDVLIISTWFRALPPARLTAYGYYGPHYGGIRYVFRPGLYLSFAVYSELALLPYELELELGELPWYLERRIYGSTVLVIDRRSRLVVDIYDLDY